MSTGLVAVRRNLTPGAVFFRQVGSIVYYSLDNTTWQIAWRIPDAPAAPEWKETFPPTTGATVENITNMYINMGGSLTVNNITAGQMPPSAGQVKRNLCTAATAAAVYFLAWLDVVREENFDAAANQQNTIVKLGAAIVGVIGVAAATLLTGGAALVVGGLAGAFAGGMTIGGEINDAIIAGENVPTMINEENLTAITCAIVDAMSVPGAGRNQFKTALYDAPNIVESAGWAFEKLVLTTPEFYSMFLSALTDSTSAACPCNDCYAPQMIETSFTNGRLIHGNRIVSPRLRTDYYGGYKSLQVEFAVDPPSQIDYVRCEFAGNGIGVMSGLTWGPTRAFLGVTLLADFNQSQGVGFYPPLPTAGVYTYEFDFTPYTLANPPHTIRIIHHCTWATLAAQKNAIDVLYDWALTYFEYCTRGA